MSVKTSLILPSFKDGIFETSIKPETKLDLISAFDQAKYARDVFQTIEKYDKQGVELTSAKMTTKEMSEILSKVLGKELKEVYSKPEKLEIKKRFFKSLVGNYVYYNYERYQFDLEKVKEKGFEMISFEEFCNMYKSRIEIL